MTTPHKTYRKHARRLYRILIVVCVFVLIMAVLVWYWHNGQSTGKPNQEYSAVPKDNADVQESGNDRSHGFIEAPGMQETINNCTNCHSAQLVTQNRMTREGWLSTIRWMQETQNLWDLGENEALILDYLALHYAPEEKGRRAPLQDIEWYTLTD